MGMNITWKGSGVNEIGISDDDLSLVKVSREFYRPLESDNYRADYSKARRKLKWQPETTFSELIMIMVEKD